MKTRNISTNIIKLFIKRKYKNKTFIILFFLFISKFFFIQKCKIYSKDNVTLVTALFKIKSKYPLANYISWVQNLLLLNSSIVFFVDKKILSIIKRKRPKKYENKTIWIISSIDKFYSYKNFRNNFKESYSIDFENNIHSIPLYLVWAEKCYFIKKAIYHNYFNSECFYWIDAGYFREKEYKYYNNWPSIRKCYEDPRVLINGIRKVSEDEIEGLKNFNISIYNNFIKRDNVAGGLFGGKPEYLINFTNLYYKAIKDFIKHRMFIGKDQNLFAYVSYLNPKIVKIINSGNWYFFKKYLFD